MLAPILESSAFQIGFVLVLVVFVFFGFVREKVPSDVVALLVRPEVYEDDEDTRSDLAGKAELLIAKQRNGPIGEIPLTFIKEYTRFENAAFERQPEGD